LDDLWLFWCWQQVGCSDPLGQDWYNLICQRAMFVKARLPQDCRCLIQFVEDAERMFAPLGFKDADDFIARGLKLVPEEIRIAVDWLKVAKPQEAIPIDVAQRLAKHGEYGRGRPKEVVLQPLKKGTSEHWLLRLDRADPKDLALKAMTTDQFAELAAKVRVKSMSANAAAIEAGFRKKPKPRLDRCPYCGHDLP
jgi:hypothetical protein